MGNLIKNKLGDKTMTIFLHGPWYPRDGYEGKPVLPMDGVLDSLFSIASHRKMYPFGIDTKETSFGELGGESSVYSHGYENFVLLDFCDGYIFLQPINGYHTVTPIANFIRPENVEFVKGQELDYRGKPLTSENLNDTIRIWLEDLQQELRQMKQYASNRIGLSKGGVL